jgi:hypothetical protein
MTHRKGVRGEMIEVGEEALRGGRGSVGRVRDLKMGES